MKTAVLTDSASYIDPKLAEKYHITVVPITVIFGNQTYLEGVDISSDEFYAKMKSEPTLPTTSQVTMVQMQAAFDQLAAEGYDEVVSIHLSSGITTFYENLIAYLPNVKNIKVYPFDSKIACAGEADLALYAARLAEAGIPGEQIIPRLAKLRDSMGVDFFVDDLSHLMRTGRISNASAIVGNLLRVKPYLTFKDGKIEVAGKERTMKRAFIKAQADFDTYYQSADFPVHLNVIAGNNPTERSVWVERFKERYPDVSISTGHIGPVVGVHTGSGVMGLIWDLDWQRVEI